MVTVAEAIPAALHIPALREMFEARKRVFVDLLKWDVPVLEGRYEIRSAKLAASRALESTASVRRSASMSGAAYSMYI